jgi:hypothetical protein
MSVYEDVKKAITEFLVPEMKAEIASVRGDINSLRERVDQNEKRAQERHDVVIRELAWRFDSLKEHIQLSKRVELLELQREREAHQ